MPSYKLFERPLRVAVASVLVFGLIAGCGGGDGEEAASSAVVPPGGSGANSPPSISGTPLSSIMQGVAYSFTPAASDADGDPLTFEATNLPSWASIDPNTGQVSGQPGAADLGTYSDIRIVVRDGSASATLGPFQISVVASATGSALLTWTPPTENSDGSPLTDLAGYKIYWGTSQGNYTNSVTVNNPGLTSYVVDALTPATWHFVATAFNSAGVESSFSNAASKTISAP